ncbi:hypothetical protein IV203_022131 [Nitzschia inconspicua]|uniref:Uncharacterized protein n=1 Tax=Nitzschia inconspicua TaxID=303405 RepID=A0A9K3KI39_9STRA|nr:hypothetical protein IV203_022131 [Nitzschia inconspicua]
MRTALVVAILVSFIGVWWMQLDGPATLLDLSELQGLSQALRSDDERLIRPSPTEATIRIQTIACPSVIPSLVKTLGDKKLSLPVRGEAAEVLHLCITNNPTNRAKIGRVENGAVFDGIKDLIHTSMTTWNASIPLVHSGRIEVYQTMDLVGKTVAQAAEAVWILSFNNEMNQQGFFSAGVVDELVRTIQTCPVRFGHEGPCSEAVMWSLAALQNMAASYCDSEDGTCNWKRKKRSPELYLPRGVQKRDTRHVDQMVRDRIMQYVKKENFGSLLNYLLCAGPVKEPNSKNFSWPSKAKHIESAKRPEIVPWAAAGLVRSLALESAARNHFGQQNEDNGYLFQCLCHMHKRSPDWLEANNSFDALYRLGWNNHCEDPHDRCDDKEGWFEVETSKTCVEYEKERLCATMGTSVGKDSDVTANEACCVCGGGTMKRPEDIKQKIHPATEALFRKMVINGKW